MSPTGLLRYYFDPDLLLKNRASTAVLKALHRHRLVSSLQSFIRY